MRSRRAVLLLVFLAACGDDLSPPGSSMPGGPDAGSTGMCAETAVTEFPDEAYGGPADLPIEGCIEGGLADIDLTGRWIVVGEDAFSAELPYLRDSCES